MNRRLQWIVDRITPAYDEGRRRALVVGVVVLASPAVIKATKLLPAPVERAREAAYGSLYVELQAITRRAFTPRVQVQIYYSSPILLEMLNADKSEPPFIKMDSDRVSDRWKT